MDKLATAANHARPQGSNNDGNGTNRHVSEGTFVRHTATKGHIPITMSIIRDQERKRGVLGSADLDSQQHRRATPQTLYGRRDTTADARDVGNLFEVHFPQGG